MAAPGSFRPLQQHHEIFRRTAKELLIIRHTNATPKMRMKRALQRLESQFQDKFVSLVVRHPEHGVVAKAEIPIMYSNGKFFNINHPMEVHRFLPAVEYERCEVAVIMPGGLDLLVSRQYVVDSVTLAEVEGPLMTNAGVTVATALPCWEFFSLEYDMLVANFTGLIRDNPHNQEPHFQVGFAFTYAYPASIDVHMEGLRQVLPAAVTEATICISTTIENLGRSTFEHLQFMESWLAVARHLRDDATETVRLRSRFEDSFLLVEVCEGDHDLENSMDSCWWQNLPDHPMDKSIAFALVPLADEAALLGIFTTQTTHLQCVREGSIDRERFSPEDYQFARISLLDFEGNRVMKLTEGYHNGAGFMWGPKCILSSLDQIIMLEPVFEQVALPAGGEGECTATVMLSVEVRDRDRRLPVNSHFSSTLEVWKFLEICLSGESSCRM
jgi:hypothetical protein